MRFNRISLAVAPYEVAVLVLAAEIWLPQKAVNRTSVAVVAAMPTVATLYKKAATICKRVNKRKLAGRPLRPQEKVKLTLTVPEAAAAMAYLSEGLLGDNEGLVLFLRSLRGSIHQQLVTYEGLAFDA